MPSRETVFDEDFLQRLRQLHLLARRLTGRTAPGARRSRRLGDGLEFADHRDYTPGDDVRFIDWPYFARMEKLLLRLFHEHSEAGVFVLLDTSASMAPGDAAAKFDYARRTAAAMAYVAMASLDNVRVLPFSSEAKGGFRAGRGTGQILPVLDYLASLVPGGRSDWARCLTTVAQSCEAGTSVLVVSDLLDAGEGLEDGLARLRARQCDVTAVQVFTPAERDGDLPERVILEHAETGEDLPLDMTDALRASYRLRFEEFLQDTARRCGRHGATHVACSTAVGFEQLVLLTLRRAGVVAG